MNLIWHMVRKDLRRLAWPVAGWLAFMLGATLWARLASWSGPVLDEAKAGIWMRTTGSLGGVAGLVALGLLVVLVGVHGQEDRVVGSISFWSTRPISGGRLLGAKVVAALLLFVLAPLVLLGPVWWASGVSGGEWLRVAGCFAGMQVALVLGALTIAALTEDLGQQVLGSVIWFGLVLAVGVLVMWLEHRAETPLGLETTHWRVGGALTWGAALIALGWQYRARRTAMSFLVLATGLVWPVAVQRWWPWDWSGPGPVRAAEVAAVPLELKSPTKPVDRDLPAALWIEMPIGNTDGEWWVPLRATGLLRWADGATIRLTLERSQEWGDQTAMHVAGSVSSGGTVRWVMSTHYREGPGERVRSGAVTFSGRMTIGRMRPRVLCQMPLQAGARAESGSLTMRIMGWQENSGTTLLVEERDAPWWLVGRPPVSPTYWGRDSYLVGDGSPGIVQALRYRDLGAMEVNGLRLSMRALDIPPAPTIAGNGAARAGRREGATLWRLRFEPVAECEREISQLALRVVGEEGKR